MRAVPILLLALALAGCSGKEATINAMEKINAECEKLSGEVTVSMEAGPFGNTAKFSCTARVNP